MTLSKTDFTINPQLTEVLLAEMAQKSGFQSASKKVELDGFGSIISTLEGGKASWVTEGAVKPVSEISVTEVTVTAQKLVRVVTYTNEVALDIPKVEQLIREDAINSMAVSFDNSAAGEATGIPAGFDNLDTAVTVVNINDRKDFVQAVKPVKSQAGNSSFVINQNMLYELMGLTNPMGGALLNIVTSDNLTGTINGFPFFVYASDSAEAEGFVGPFATKAYWGEIPNSFRVITGVQSWVDSVGVQHNGPQENKEAMIVEVRVGFKVADMSLFKKITVIEPVQA